MKMSVLSITDYNVPQEYLVHPYIRDKVSAHSTTQDHHGNHLTDPRVIVLE